MTMTTTAVRELSEALDRLEVAVRLGKEAAKAAIDAEISAHVTDDITFVLNPELTEELLRLYLAVRSDVMFSTFIELSLGGDNGGGPGYCHDGSGNTYIISVYWNRPTNKPTLTFRRRDDS